MKVGDQPAAQAPGQQSVTGPRGDPEKPFADLLRGTDHELAPEDGELLDDELNGELHGELLDDELDGELLDDELLDPRSITHSTDTQPGSTGLASLPHTGLPAGIAGASSPPPITGSAPPPPPAAAVHHVARQILRALRVGADQNARKVVFLDVTVPGHGDLRVRLRRDGDGFEARLRADNDGLARLLQAHTDDLRHAAEDNGVHFTSLQVRR